MGKARSSREWFEWIRSQALDATRTRETIERLEAREGVRAQGYGQSSSGGTRDPTDATDVRMEYEGKVGDAQRERYAAIERANEVLYGVDGRGGIDTRLGAAYAIIIDRRWLMGEKWDHVAEAVGYSPEWCRHLADVAFSFMDEHGMVPVGAKE